MKLFLLRFINIRYETQLFNNTKLSGEIKFSYQ